jgi:hypothetical protein
VNKLWKLPLICGWDGKSEVETKMSSQKKPRKAKASKHPKMRVFVEKKAFDKVLGKLIQSPPMKRDSQ